LKGVSDIKFGILLFHYVNVREFIITYD